MIVELLGGPADGVRIAVVDGARHVAGFAVRELDGVLVSEEYRADPGWRVGGGGVARFRYAGIRDVAPLAPWVPNPFVA